MILPSVQELQDILDKMRDNLKANIQPEYQEIRDTISMTHSWILKVRSDISFYECTKCGLDASDTVSYPLHQADEPVTDNLPVMTWNHRPLYLTCAQNLERKELKKVKGKPWKVYILECQGNPTTLYTGITNNLYQRYMDHKEKRRGKGAKYTSKNYPLKILHTETYSTKSEALKREYRIKQFSRQEKLDLIKGTP